MTLTALFLTTSLQFSLPPGLLNALCYVESTHNPNKIHYNDGAANSIGVCQIQLPTAQWLGFDGTEEDLMDPETNIYYAAAYLSYQLHRYNSITKAVIAYNYGHAPRNLTSTRYQATVYRQWEADNASRH